MTLADKTVFVTGGSRGIGAGIAKYLAEQGAKVAISYSSSEEKAKKVLEDLPGSGHILIQMNVSDKDSVQAAFKKLYESFDKLDGLVNNAGITKDNLFLKMSADEFDAVINTNLRGTFLCCKEVARPMMRNRGGSVVNVTSVIGQTGNAGQANYAASKAGTVAMTKSLAQEFASRGVRFNCVAPGFIGTDMTDVLEEEHKQAIIKKIPLGKIGDVEDIASAVSWLLGDGAKYVTGQTIHVNGGMLMP